MHCAKALCRDHASARRRGRGREKRSSTAHSFGSGGESHPAARRRNAPRVVGNPACDYRFVSGRGKSGAGLPTVELPVRTASPTRHRQGSRERKTIRRSAASLLATYQRCGIGCSHVAPHRAQRHVRAVAALAITSTRSLPSQRTHAGIGRRPLRRSCLGTNWPNVGLSLLWTRSRALSEPLDLSVTLLRSVLRVSPLARVASTSCYRAVKFPSLRPGNVLIATICHAST